jgi:hypothetical protein
MSPITVANATKIAKSHYSTRLPVQAATSARCGAARVFTLARVKSLMVLHPRAGDPDRDIVRYLA